MIDEENGEDESQQSHIYQCKIVLLNLCIN